MASSKTTADTTALGETGLVQTGGVIREEFLKELQGSKAAKVFKEMADNDPIVGAFLFAVEQIMRQVEWKVLPFDESAAAQKDAEFVDSCRLDLTAPWSDFLTEVLSFLPFGYAPFEVTYKPRQGPQTQERMSSRYTDGLLGWQQFGIRAQETIVGWDFDPAGTGDVLAMRQQKLSGQIVSIPLERLLIFRTKSRKNNPEGRSILRNAYRPWYFKKRIEEVEGIGVERDMAGLPVLKAPQGVDLWNELNPKATESRRAAENIVRGLRRDEMEGVLLPFGWELELLSAKGTRLFDTVGIINRYDQRIAMTVLADFIMLGHAGRTGSFALAKSKTSVFMISIVGYVNMIRDIFNQYAIPRLFLVNGKDLEKIPRLDYDSVEVQPLRELAVFLRVLFDAGVQVNDNLFRHLLNVAGLPADLSDEAGQGGVRRTPRAKKGKERAGQVQPDEAVTDPVTRT